MGTLYMTSQISHELYMSTKKLKDETLECGLEIKIFKYPGLQAISSNESHG